MIYTLNKKELNSFLFFFFNLEFHTYILLWFNVNFPGGLDS